MKCAADHSECFDARLDSIVYSRIWTMSTKLVFRSALSFACHAQPAGGFTDLTCAGSLPSGASHIHRSRIILKAGRICRCIWLAVSLIALSGGAVANVSAQQTRANIRLAPDSDRVIVEGSSGPATVWSFLDSYASVVGLANRIERFTLFDEGDHAGITIQKRPHGRGAAATFDDHSIRIRREADVCSRLLG